MAGMRNMTLVFQHIPKTAGTTLSHVVARQFAPDEIYHVRDPGQPRAPRYSDAWGSIEQFIALPESQRARFRCVLGHMHFGIHHFLPGPARYLTVLRDPVERILSQHDQYTRMVKKGDLADSDRLLTLEQFIAAKPAVADNHQTRFLCGCHALDGWEYDEHSLEENLDRAKRHLREHCVVVGTVQRFDETMVVLGRRMGWPDVRYVRYNVGSARARRADPATIQAIAHRNALDREVHAFADALLDEAIAEIGPTFADQLAAYRASTDLPRPLGQRLRGFVAKIWRGQPSSGRRKGARRQRGAR